jgi:hypothetical protein
MRVRFFGVQLLAVVALGAPILALAAPQTAPSSQLQPKAASAAADTLTLYSEPGFKGRHATYHFASVDVERQGFVARSAASKSMWTLCEGGEVASRCQTVNGQTPELRFAPQLVRPGVNALALYDQPGLKGRRVVYSFTADHPAPFHARSARTWGGPWSVCARRFHGCQTLDGKATNLDMVVGAVRPDPVIAISVSDPLPQVIQTAPVKAPSVHVHKVAKPVVLAAPKPTKSLPAKIHALPAKATPGPQPPHPQKLVHLAAPHAAAPPPRHLVIQLSDDLPRRHRHDARAHDWRVRDPSPHHSRHRHLTSVRHEPPPPREFAWRHGKDLRLVHASHPAHHAFRGKLVHMVSDRHARRTHASHHRLYHRVKMYWGGSDPYLYDAEPRDDGSSPW